MSKQTLYQRATEEMTAIIRELLKLSEVTRNFTTPPDEIWSDELASKFLLGGFGYHINNLPPIERRKDAWLARSAMSFSIEHAATGVLYEQLQPFIDSMIETAFTETRDFTEVTPEWIHDNAHFLPVIMHAVGTFSKQELTRLIGSVSDTGISRPASERLVSLIAEVEPEAIARPEQIRERIKATTEGIVRDLVGRLLLEEFVASSLREAGVPFRRESEYVALTGVVYDFRADFVVPDEAEPRAFIEVRKSSSRHASLYSKDKMFSAINWKGRHADCLGIIVVDGPWTEASLNVMSRVFDYVVPIGRAGEVARTIRRYLEGDKDVLRWLIHFRIEAYKP
jgi:hypothetical protein